MILYCTIGTVLLASLTAPFWGDDFIDYIRIAFIFWLIADDRKAHVCHVNSPDAFHRPTADHFPCLICARGPPARELRHRAPFRPLSVRAMDFFTESVDAALWSSRTFEDPSYDDDPTAAAESRAPVSVERHADQQAPSHLIVSASGAADAVLDGLAPPSLRTPFATLSGAGLSERSIELCTDGPLQSCAVLRASGISDDRAVLWAAAAVGAVGDAKIVVATCTPRAQIQGGNEAGVRMLAASPVEMQGVPELQEPNFVAGAAAAVLAEVAWEGMEAVCLIGVTERANYEVDEVIALADATCKAVTALGGNAAMSDEAREGVRCAVKKSAVQAHDSIYL